MSGMDADGWARCWGQEHRLLSTLQEVVGPPHLSLACDAAVLSSSCYICTVQIWTNAPVCRSSSRWLQALSISPSIGIWGVVLGR